MNKTISNIHLDNLDKARRELLRKLLPYTNDFILGGGTALALQLNHRKSFDFDFFGSTALSRSFLEHIAKSIEIGNLSVDTTDELTFFTKNEIKVTFLYYPFPHA